MYGGQLAAETALATANPSPSSSPSPSPSREKFMKAHDQVFMVLGFMQNFWQSTDNRRESFVRICGDKDFRSLTWTTYINKVLVRPKPDAHLRIFAKNIAHLTALARAKKLRLPRSRSVPRHSETLLYELLRSSPSF